MESDENKIILLQDVIDQRDRKEKEIAFYQSELEKIEERLFFLRKEQQLTQFIIDAIQNEKLLDVREYLEEKRARLYPKRAHTFPKEDKHIFLKKTGSNKLPLASAVIKENKELLSQVIKQETDQYLYRVNQALDLFITDCR